ncbi:hypothetical protein [Lysinibacillus boronitolerans]|uniref:hypothetical protein n=1 Tax=Lysinibacillus boronitolerans TaxID=309788 RepID=UPI00036C5A24|nr:hypothetical protein [Lysinibacillus boronitolerans]
MNNRIFQSVDANPNERFDIGFELVLGQTATELPEEISILHRDIEETTTIIKNLIYTPESDKERYFNKLLDLSKFAFLTENENAIPLATNYLIVLREEILLSEGPRIKNVHMKKLGLGILGIIVVSWLIFFITFVSSNSTKRRTSNVFYCMYRFVSWNLDFIRGS